MKIAFPSLNLLSKYLSTIGFYGIILIITYTGVKIKIKRFLLLHNSFANECGTKKVIMNYSSTHNPELKMKHRIIKNKQSNKSISEISMEKN